MRGIAAIFSAVIVCNAAMVCAQSSSALPHVLVYKMNARYKNLVPVQLSEDKKSVVSYPDPKDIKTGGSKLLPVSLHKGYWLDRRGVGPNTAFIKLSTEEYARLKTAPSPTDLYNMIVDKSPVTDICDCGTRNSKNTTAKYLNDLIDRKLLKKKCKEVK